MVSMEKIFRDFKYIVSIIHTGTLQIDTLCPGQTTEHPNTWFHVRRNCDMQQRPYRNTKMRRRNVGMYMKLFEGWRVGKLAANCWGRERESGAVPRMR